MFKDAFRQVSGEERRRLVARANARLDAAFDPEETRILAHPLPFYDGYSLAILTRTGAPPAIERAIVYDARAEGGAVVVLDWSYAPIYDLNDRAPLTLADDCLADYVRFFFTYVRGPEGRFLIVESPDDIRWREEPSPSGKKALAKLIEPVRYESRDAGGTALLSFSFVFRDSLMAAKAHVAPDGRIRLDGEEILVETLPVADDLLAA